MKDLDFFTKAVEPEQLARLTGNEVSRVERYTIPEMLHNLSRSISSGKCSGKAEAKLQEDDLNCVKTMALNFLVDGEEVRRRLTKCHFDCRQQTENNKSPLLEHFLPTDLYAAITSVASLCTALDYIDTFFRTVFNWNELFRPLYKKLHPQPNTYMGSRNGMDFILDRVYQIFFAFSIAAQNQGYLERFSPQKWLETFREIVQRMTDLPLGRYQEDQWMEENPLSWSFSAELGPLVKKAGVVATKAPPTSILKKEVTIREPKGHGSDGGQTQQASRAQQSGNSRASGGNKDTICFKDLRHKMGLIDPKTGLVHAPCLGGADHGSPPTRLHLDELKTKYSHPKKKYSLAYATQQATQMNQGKPEMCDAMILKFKGLKDVFE